MNKYITYCKINKILLSIKKEWITKEIFLNLEYKEIEKLWFIQVENTNLEIIWDSGYSITYEWENFLNSYKWCKKIEYFFQDFPFFGTILIWAIWWIIWWIILKIF